MLRACETWSPEAFPGIVVLANGQVPVLEGERVAGAVGRLLMRFRVDPTARIRMTGPNCDSGPILVQVNAQPAGTPIRVQTLTYGRGDALPVLVRLERQLWTVREARSPRPWPDPTRPPLDAPGPGILMCRKTVALQTAEPLTAAVVMDAMDYDVHLFTDADTGDDAIVYRAQPSGLRLARQHCVHPPRTAAVAAATPVPLITCPRPAPVLTEHEAADRVREHGLPFLFYTDLDTGRGHLTYRRYDSGLGLITPAFDAGAVRS
ncbi:sigma 54 modulation/S30EA ribosomal C-terminal domain-containing protein [Nocardia niigatensis]|uniref:sigma 54 modulation/S30EA ribosomal C-terminal domain-containing protein n=1 Tax=Nocardia niigatensis TaxID=209249 RepID=UPI0002D75CB6|nr:sigma 54 modulation/S30EA ribosomal C-terminal domain-containing protein [Nocardia niigatensis]